MAVDCVKWTCCGYSGLSFDKDEGGEGEGIANIFYRARSNI